MIQPIICVFYKFTAKEICRLRGINKSDRHVAEFIPPYAFNKEYDNNVVSTDGFFQFFDENMVDHLDSPEEEYILFDIITSGILEEEISYIGFEDFFGNKKEFAKVIEHIDIWETYETYNRSISYVTTILVDCKYYGGNSRYEWDDVEFECSLFGIIDSTGNVIKL